MTHARSNLDQTNHLILPINQAHQFLAILMGHNNYDWGVTVDTQPDHWRLWLTDEQLARYEEVKEQLDPPMTAEQAWA